MSAAIDIDTFQQAILQYRNTPDPTTKLSPAMCLFGRRPLAWQVPSPPRHTTPTRGGLTTPPHVSTPGWTPLRIGDGRHSTPIPCSFRTLRNRKFLRQYTPPRSILDDLAQLPLALQPTPPLPLPTQVPHDEPPSEVILPPASPPSLTSPPLTHLSSRTTHRPDRPTGLLMTLIMAL